MHDDGDPPARPGRPSLLSPGPQAEPEHKRILNTLDGAAGPSASAGPARRQRRGPVRSWTWGVAAVGVIAVGGLLFALSGGDEHGGPTATPVIVAEAPAVASSVPAAAASVPAPASAAVPAPAEVSTAAVLQEPREAPEAPVANPLSALAASPAAKSSVAHTRTSGEHLTQALEKPSKKEAAPRKPRHKAEPTKLASKNDKEKAAKARPRREPDNDVILLAALMSHMQPRNKKATVPEQLQICKQYNAVGEEQCRVRVCASAGTKEAACKGVPTARTLPDS